MSRPLRRTAFADKIVFKPSQRNHSFNFAQFLIFLLKSRLELLVVERNGCTFINEESCCQKKELRWSKVYISVRIKHIKQILDLMKVTLIR